MEFLWGLLSRVCKVLEEGAHPIVTPLKAQCIVPTAPGPQRVREGPSTLRLASFSLIILDMILWVCLCLRNQT
jgi:hypothetical protein